MRTTGVLSQGLLRQRAFRLLWIGESTSSVGTAITKVALPLIAVTTLRASTLAVGLLYAAAWLPWLVIGLMAGVWVDRLPRRRIMVGCDVLSLLALISVPLASWFGILTIAQLVFVAIVAGASSVLFSTAYVAFLPSLVGREHLAEGNAKLEGSRQAAQIAGPGLAGVLSELLGAVFGLFVDAITFGMSGLCLLRIGTGEAAEVPVRRPRTKIRTEIGEGLRLTYRDHYLRVFAIYGAAGNLALSGWQTLEVMFLVRVVHVDSATVGILLALIGVGGVAGVLSARAIAARLGSARGVILCAVGTAPLGLLCPLAATGPRLALFAVGGFFAAAGIAASNVIVRSFNQTYCPAHLLGRLTATTRTLAYGVIPIGALLAAGLGTVFGIRTSFWLTTSLLVASSLILLARPIRTQSELPAHSDESIMSALPVHA